MLERALESIFEALALAPDLCAQCSHHPIEPVTEVL